MTKVHYCPYHDSSRRNPRVMFQFASHLHQSFYHLIFCEWISICYHLIGNTYYAMLKLISGKNIYQYIWCGKIFPHHKFLQGLFIPCMMLENALEPSIPPKQNMGNKQRHYLLTIENSNSVWSHFQKYLVIHVLPEYNYISTHAFL